MNEGPILSIVIPVYCESDILLDVIQTVENHVRPLDLAYELIFVDDGSADNTWPILEDAARKNPRLRGVRLSRNFGKETALCAGIEMAAGRAVITMDGDLQHPPELIREMVELWKNRGIEVVDAVKVSRGQEAILKRISAILFYRVFKEFSGFDLRGLSDYKLMDRRVVDAWLQIQERNMFFRGMVAWLGFRHATVSFTPLERSGGKSKWSISRLIGLSVNAVINFSAKPLYFVGLMGVIFLIGALKVLLDVFYQIMEGTAVSGFATVILLLLIIGGMIMLSLSLIGIYIAKIYEEVKQRPRFIIAEKIEQTFDKQKIVAAIAQNQIENLG